MSKIALEELTQQLCVACIWREDIDSCSGSPKQIQVARMRINGRHIAEENQ